MRADDEVVAAFEVRRLEERVGERERLLGRKSKEVELLKEAPVWHGQKRCCCRSPLPEISCGDNRRAVGVSRSNLIKRPRRRQAKGGPRTGRV